MVRLGQQVNLLWIVIGAVLVIFMQAGFALVETGFCRAKHAAHVVSTNFAIFGLGFVAFFLVGFALMFGGYSLRAAGADFGYDEAASASSLIGSRATGCSSGRAASPLEPTSRKAGRRRRRRLLPLHGGLHGHRRHHPDRLHGRAVEVEEPSSSGACSAAPSTTRCSAPGPGAAAGCASSATRRTSGYGYVDFAGSGVVHAMGGVAALAGAIVLGPRIGKYGKDGKPRALPGHHIPMAMLGTFILLFGWFGFNAASTFAATDVRSPSSPSTPRIAGAFGADDRHVLDHDAQPASPTRA